jgi:hypothetical protein
MNALKAGVLSKNFEVAEWTAKVIQKLAYNFGESALLDAGWEWFISDIGGINSMILSIKRHPELSSQIVFIILQFARYNIVEMFTSIMRKFLPQPSE